MTIVLASRNKHKIEELRALLAHYIPDIKVLSLDDIGFEGDIVENGQSFEENALIKARAVASRGYIGVGDDSGLSVRALGGEPGIYSARYAGGHGDDAANNTLLLHRLADKADRYAEFVCAMACAFPNESEKDFCVCGAAQGRIIDEYRGSGGFGYDPIFYIDELGKTYAELTPNEKNAISHRGRATELFARELCKIKN